MPEEEKPLLLVHELTDAHQTAINNYLIDLQNISSLSEKEWNKILIKVKMLLKYLINY
ncbi:hypothetical protein [Spiroplasma endosymbiont of Nebria brevicollis]|uniref:hypothetical protein n=1 Tax=Spiroplasma endosymbiont of Nebria brevicollis TaxID=3066284 RepID=UPI00313E4810